MISNTRFLLLFITLQHRILRCIHCGQNIQGGGQTFTSPTLHKNTLLALQIKAIALSLSEMHSFVQQPSFSQVLYVLLFGSSVSLRTSHNITAFAPRRKAAQRSRRPPLPSNCMSLVKQHCRSPTLSSQLQKSGRHFQLFHERMLYIYIIINIYFIIIYLYLFHYNISIFIYNYCNTTSL